MRLFPEAPVSDRLALNEVVERGVLSYLLAQTYDKKPTKHALDQQLTFTPLVPKVWMPDDPAASSDILILDFEETSEPSPQNGQYLVPGSKTGIRPYLRALLSLICFL